MEEKKRKVSLLNRLRVRLSRPKSSTPPAVKYFVIGSGLVHVPQERLGEIPRVVAEHHERERDLAYMIARAKIAKA